MNPWKETGMAEVTATLKYGKGYEAPWLVIKGENAADVKKAVEEATGLAGEGLTLSQVIYNAADHVQRLNTVGVTLGATVIADEPEDAPAETAPAPDPAPEQQGPDLEQQIKDASDVSSLADLYIKYQATFDSDEKLSGLLQARVEAVK